MACVASGRVLPCKVTYARSSICCVMRGVGPTSLPLCVMGLGVRPYEVSANVVTNVSNRRYRSPSRDFLVMENSPSASSRRELTIAIVIDPNLCYRERGSRYPGTYQGKQ